MQSIIWLLLLIQFNEIPKVFSDRSFEITRTIQELNAAYNVNNNIFINWNESEDDLVDLQQLDTCKIHLNLYAKSFNNFRILGKFTEKSIIIVYIKKGLLDESLMEMLPSLMWRLHELHIVFITKDEPVAWLEDLFNYSFREGFINVLLIQQYNQTLSLYSYNPYPNIQVQRLSHLGDYFNRKFQLQNFNHFPIRTVSIRMEPRMIEYVNRKGQLVFAGYMYHAMMEFIRHYNATLKILKESPKSFADGIVMMGKKGMDFACYPKEIQWNMSGTAPLYLMNDYFAVPYSRPIASYLYFSRPFQSTLWLAVMGTVGYGMLALYIIYKKNGTEISLEFLCSWCYVLFLSQPYFRISNWKQFVVHCLLLLFGFILTNLYLTMLSSMLTSGLFEPQLNTMKDLIHSPYPLLADDFIADYFNNLDIIPREIHDRMIIVPGTTLDEARTGLNTSFMYIGYDDRLEAILYQQNLLKVPLFKLITKSFKEGIMSISIADGLPYLSMLNTYLRRIFECGILQKMKSDAWMDTIESGIYKLFRSERLEQKPYDLEFYFYAFASWAIGLVLAVLSFLLELLRGRYFLY